MFLSRFSFADAILLLSVLCLALVLLFLPPLLQSQGAFLSVTTPSETLRFPLSKDQTFSIVSKDVSLTLEILNGKARVLHSSCPDKTCVSSGWIEKSGDSIVCAPAGVRLLIEQNKGGSDHVDFVAG